jgi:hypothetical protein
LDGYFGILKLLTYDMIINEEYLSSTALSQSKLKKLLVHPQLFINYNTEDDTDEPKETTVIGDAVDLILTQSSDAFYHAFYTTDVEKPGAMMGVFVWQLFVNRDSSDAELIAYERSGFKIKLDKVRERFEKEGKYYYEALLESNGKTVITSAQKTKIDNIVESLKNNEFTSEWINGSDRYEVHKQVVVEFEYQGHKCKGLLDLVVLDKETGIVYPIDLKTTSSPTNSWVSMFWKFRYDIQAAFYTYGIVSSGLVEKLGGKSLHNFRFIVETQDYPGSPLIYEIDDVILAMGQFGGEYNGRQYEGFADAIKRYEWHIANDLWNYPMQDYQNKGIRIIGERLL